MSKKTGSLTVKTKILSVAGQRKSKGITSKEIETLMGLHHGSVSGALSHLHERGYLVRLAGVTRDGYKVYVLPEWQGDRPIEAYGRRKAECSNPECVAMEQMYFDAARRVQELEALLK